MRCTVRVPYSPINISEGAKHQRSRIQVRLENQVATFNINLDRFTSSIGPVDVASEDNNSGVTGSGEEGWITISRM